MGKCVVETEEPRHGRITQLAHGSVISVVTFTRRSSDECCKEEKTVSVNTTKDVQREKIFGRKTVILQRVSLFSERVAWTEWTRRTAYSNAVNKNLSNYAAILRNHFIIGMYYPVPGVASKIY